VSPPPEGRGGRRRGAAWWVGAGILLSRISGLVRDATVAYWLGSGRLADVAAAGLRIPNVLQNLLGEGTLSASFIPVYARMLDEGREEEAGRFAGAILGILTLVAFGVALLGVLAAPLLSELLLSQRDEASRALLATILRILFPMTATLVVSAWALGVLNSHRRFFLSYVAPVLWNAAIVAALVVAGSAVASGEGTPERIVVSFAWGALVGAGLQLGVQLPVVFRLLRGFRLSVGRRVAGVAEAIRAFGPVVAARGVVNLSAWVDVALAGLLIEGAVINLQRAQTFYLLPISLFAMAVAASELPELSRVGAGAASSLADPVRAALRRVRFFLIPSTVAYLLFGDLLVAGLYQRGAFGSQDATVVGWILGAYALGLVASGSSRTLSSAFYAVGDTRTPAKIATGRVVLALGLGGALMFPLDGVRVGSFGLGAAGLALGSAVAAWLEYALLRRALAHRIGPHAPGWGGAGRLVVAAAVGGAAAVAVRRGLGATGVDLLVAAIGTAAAFGVVYLGVAGLFGDGVPLRRRTR
jgi:putative peptidoglycan lipid II flippase